MDHCIAISMSQNGSPYENALTERLNGIIKLKFTSRKLYRNHVEARQATVNFISA
jgi:transposase InsO family protein